MLQVAGADVVDVATLEVAADEEAGISGSGDGVSTTELDGVSWTGVGAVSEDTTGSDDGDALITGATVEEMVSVSEDAIDSDEGEAVITGATVEEMVSVSVSIGTAWDSVDTGVGVVDGSTDVTSAVVDATEETISTCEEATSDVTSEAVAVLKSSVVVAGDSARVSKTLGELVIASVEAVTPDVASEAGGWPAAESTSEAAVDSGVASSGDKLSTAVTDALALVANVLRYRLSTDGIVDEEDGTGSASDALVACDEVVEEDAVLGGEADDEPACVLAAGGTLAGAIGAFAGVDEADETDEDAGLQLPKPGWQPLPQYASVLPLCRISIQ